MSYSTTNAPSYLMSVNIYVYLKILLNVLVSVSYPLQHPGSYIWINETFCTKNAAHITTTTLYGTVTETHDISIKLHAFKPFEALADVNTCRATVPTRPLPVPKQGEKRLVTQRSQHFQSIGLFSPVRRVPRGPTNTTYQKWILL